MWMMWKSLWLARLINSWSITGWVLFFLADTIVMLWVVRFGGAAWLVARNLDDLGSWSLEQWVNSLFRGSDSEITWGPAEVQFGALVIWAVHAAFFLFSLPLVLN